jgi:hypothetical protein
MPLRTSHLTGSPSIPSTHTEGAASSGSVAEDFTLQPFPMPDVIALPTGSVVDDLNSTVLVVLHLGFCRSIHH